MLYAVLNTTHSLLKIRASMIETSSRHPRAASRCKALHKSNRPGINAYINNPAFYPWDCRRHRVGLTRLCLVRTRLCGAGTRRSCSPRRSCSGWPGSSQPRRSSGIRPASLRSPRPQLRAPRCRWYRSPRHSPGWCARAGSCSWSSRSSCYGKLVNASLSSSDTVLIQRLSLTRLFNSSCTTDY